MGKLEDIRPSQGRIIVEVFEGERDSLSNTSTKEYVAVKIGKPCQFRPVDKTAIGRKVLIDNTRFGHSVQIEGRNFLVTEQASISLVF